MAEFFCVNGIVYADAGEDIQKYDEQININPDDADSYYNFGLECQKHGDMKHSEVYFAKAKELG